MREDASAAFAIVVFSTIFIASYVTLESVFHTELVAIPAAIAAFAGAVVAFISANLVTATFSGLVGFLVSSAGGSFHRFHLYTRATISFLKFEKDEFANSMHSVHLIFKLTCKGSVAIRAVRPNAPSFMPPMETSLLINKVSVMGKKPVAGNSKERIDNPSEIRFGWSLSEDLAALSEGPLDDLYLIKGQSLYLVYPAPHEITVEDIETETATSSRMSLNPDPSKTYTIMMSAGIIYWNGNSNSPSVRMKKRYS